MAEPEIVDATRRTRLANERTFLAWLRSALTAFAVAVGAGKIVPGVTDVTRWPFELLGAGFAAVGVGLVVYGARRFVAVERALTVGEFPPLERTDAVVLASVLAVLGVATLGFIFIR